MIQFGPWHPDSAGINTPVVREARNVVPAENGFAPLQDAEATTPALPSEVRGAISVLLDDGSVETFAGTGVKLYRLGSDTNWSDVSAAEWVLDDSGTPITIDEELLADSGEVITDDFGNPIGFEAIIDTAGDNYGVGTGEQWKFALYGDLLITTNITDGPQKFDLSSSTVFEPLGGNPPAARYIDIVREFVFLGSVAGNEKRVQWSAIGNAEGWVEGTNLSDFQDFPNGGPVRGIVGGETGYIFQALKVSRATFVPGSALVFQFDEVEGAAGLSAPHSLVRLRSDAFYLAADGFRRFNLASAASVPIGTKKWLKWFLADKKLGTELTVIGAANPVKPIIVWAYVSTSNSGVVPDRLLIYDWSLDEASFADLSAETLVQWLSPGVTLDTMDSYGTLDALPFSLDSPFWRGGAQVMGLFGTDHRLSLLAGASMAATIVTADGQSDFRALIKGLRPAVDTSQATMALSMRERDADAVLFGAAEAMEDTGVCPQFKSGNIARAKLIIPAGATWTAAKGIATEATRQGKR